MKNLIFVVITLLFIACNKEQKIIPTDGDYDFSKDSCGHNLLKGIYVSTSNNLDTIVIDSNISAYVNGAKPYTGLYVDIFRFCATKDTLTLNRWGSTKPLTPEVRVKYTYSSYIIKFDKMDFGGYNGLADQWFASIDNKSFTKVK
ncbi:MAG: hypothetical protein MUE72_14390 [Chitinophagaceae bacterium]|jgi:hypothetical protein|nr:hypothetical protein [Chitinophagaceae bacterium]